MISDYSERYRPQTLEDVVKELIAHIPHDDSQQPDAEDLKLYRHQDRYQKFRLKD